VKVVGMGMRLYLRLHVVNRMCSNNMSFFLCYAYETVVFKRPFVRTKVLLWG
jgi:hypothetical protein